MNMPKYRSSDSTVQPFWGGIPNQNEEIRISLVTSYQTLMLFLILFSFFLLFFSYFNNHNKINNYNNININKDDHRINLILIIKFSWKKVKTKRENDENMNKKKWKILHSKATENVNYSNMKGWKMKEIEEWCDAI